MTGPGRRGPTRALAAWVRDAACAADGLQPALRAVFTADGRTSSDRAAVAVCRECPVAEPCAAYATTTDVTGIWAGRRRRLHARGRSSGSTATPSPPADTVAGPEGVADH